LLLLRKEERDPEAIETKGRRGNYAKVVPEEKGTVEEEIKNAWCLIITTEKRAKATSLKTKEGEEKLKEGGKLKAKTRLSKKRPKKGRLDDMKV